jgi:hypothetical protein
MSYVNILVSTPSPASRPLPAVVSSLATAMKYLLTHQGRRSIDTNKIKNEIKIILTIMRSIQCIHLNDLKVSVTFSAATVCMTFK